MANKFRTKYIILATLILLMIAGIWFYLTLYSTTGSALQRAESFLFQRMTVSQLGEQGSMRYFFVTNRKKTEENKELALQFGKDRESQLKFGFYDTKIEPSVGLGMFINPSEWFQNEEIKIRKIESLQQADFVSRLKKIVHNSPQRSLLVVVHGYKEAFPSALRKTAFLGHILDINSPVLLFDWPGNQGSSLRGYRRARRVSIESGADLSDTLKLIVRKIKPKKLWLVANSMGGEVVVNAFSQLYKDPEFSDNEVEIDHVILTAPDVSQEEFDNRFKREILALAKNLTVYVSSNDRALVMSRLVNRDSRRGESTLGPDMLEQATRMSSLIDKDDDVVALVDVTPVNRTRNFHNFSLETPEYFDDLYLRLTNEKMPRSRSIYRFQTQKGANYWVLTPGR
jgi:esterase/lipase superfamily enzyme